MMRRPIWTAKDGVCVGVPADCNSPDADPSKNMYASRPACEKACGSPSPSPSPKPIKNCTKTGPWPTGRKNCASLRSLREYPAAWTRTGGACVMVKRDCNGPAIDPAQNLYESKGACEVACEPGGTTAPTAPTVPTAPASPAPGVVPVKRLLDPSSRPAVRTDPRLAQLPPPVQSELARLAVRGTATEIRNATVDLGGSTVGVLGGEFAGAPVGPDDVSAINQYLDQLSRQPASLLAGN